MNLQPFNNQRGFTLIELLIVILVSAIVLTAVMQVFIGSQISYNVQEDVASMQQNVRAAKMFLERDIRMAGSGAMNLQGPNKGLILPLEFENGGAAGTDVLTIMYDRSVAEPCGAQPVGGPILCSDLPTLTLNASMNENSPMALINEDLGSVEYSGWINDCFCGGATYTPGDNTPIIVNTPDKSKTSILIATSIPGSNDRISNGTNVQYAQIPEPFNREIYNLIDEGPATRLENRQLNSFDSGSTINFYVPGQAYRASYFVTVDAVTGISSLMLTTGNGTEVLAEHIEDFQCSFELEDGTIVNDRDLVSSDDEALDEIFKVRLVTISILGRSQNPHVQGGPFAGQRPAIEDHAAGPADNFRRRLLTTTIKVRNFGLAGN